VNIICLSKDDWDDRCGRKQQLMFAVANNDSRNQVIYAEPPRIARYLRHSKFVNKNHLNSFLVPPKNLQVCSSYRLPFERYSFFRVIGRRLRFKSILQNSSVFFKGSLPDVLWIYNPWDSVLFRNRNAPWIKVVDWTEDWTRFQPNSDKVLSQKFSDAQKKMISRADIVFVVTECLFNEAIKFNQNIHLVPNATIPGHFASEAWMKKDVPQECRKLKRPVLGWVGHIGDYFDFEITHLLAKAFPEGSILLIGGYSDKAKALCSHHNVHLLGHKPYSEVPNYVRCFDVCIAPYIQGLTGSPTKLYDYLASGKPIVGRFDSVGDQEKKYYSSTNTIEEFITEINSAVKSEIKGGHQDRNEYVRNQSWNARAEIVSTRLKQEIEIRTRKGIY
jgi:glycosyltransferase involved in cell wall biosynthesis